MTYIFSHWVEWRVFRLNQETPRALWPSQVFRENTSPYTIVSRKLQGRALRGQVQSFLWKLKTHADELFEILR
jgi:hypothetical protein